MLSLFCDMNYVVSTFVEVLESDNKQFYQHVYKNILITNEEEEPLPITVYLLLTPMVSL